MNTVYLVANGDLRLSANQQCEPAQAELESALAAALEREKTELKRAHRFDEKKGHGFIDSQKMGIEVFRTIPEDAPLIVAEAVWQYSQHLLPGLFAHEGPILTVGNWSGTWPGLVGLLNLNACLLKGGVKYSSLWSEDFRDSFFTRELARWLEKGKVEQDDSHLTKFKDAKIPGTERKLGERLAKKFRRHPSIMGVFDEGCMGMYNAILPDEVLRPLGIYKERLSQSTLFARMLAVSDHDAWSIYHWLREYGVHFHFGVNEETDLTENQVIQQCRMYVAAVRTAHEFGCAAIGIQYQQGLKDLAPASDLIEGLLNNVNRPPVYDDATGAEIFPGAAVPHFNEVDECAGVDALITNRLWKELGYAPETTLHDLRWGREYQADGRSAYVWVFQISGGAPPDHFIDGYRGTHVHRQPPMYFRLGGGTCSGVSKPGWVVWSRVFLKKDELCFDTGIAEIVALPSEETRDRLEKTTEQWPIMHAVLPGITRDQMMARHASNHIQVAYVPDQASARNAMFAKAAVFAELGLKVHFCGEF